PPTCGHELAPTPQAERPGHVVARYTRAAGGAFTVAPARPRVPRSTRAAIPPEIREHPACCAERRIQFALRAIAAEREVDTARRIRAPGRDELPVGLPHECQGRIVPGKVGGHGALRAEARIEGTRERARGRRLQHGA